MVERPTVGAMPSPQLIIVAHAISRLIGWIYFASWSLSFYPQPILNVRRRSTAGTSPSFPFINLLGFIFYFLSTILLYASPVIRGQYAARNPAAPEPTVRPNDVAFTVHAVILSSLVLTMFSPRIWPRFEQSRMEIARWIWGIWIGCVFAIVVVIFLVTLASGQEDARNGWASIDIVYAMGYCKLLITVVKYAPQAWANYTAKSTVGWSIEQILMDFLGGVLSLVQLIIDSSLQADWSGLTGNPVKFGLGNVSIVWNVVFMVQHYVLYRDKRVVVVVVDGGGEEEAERRGLLADG